MQSLKYYRNRDLIKDIILDCLCMIIVNSFLGAGLYVLFVATFPDIHLQWLLWIEPGLALLAGALPGGPFESFFNNLPGIADVGLLLSIHAVWGLVTALLALKTCREYCSELIARMSEAAYRRRATWWVLQERMLIAIRFIVIALALLVGVMAIIGLILVFKWLGITFLDVLTLLAFAALLFFFSLLVTIPRRTRSTRRHEAQITQETIVKQIPDSGTIEGEAKEI